MSDVQTIARQNAAAAKSAARRAEAEAKSAAANAAARTAEANAAAERSRQETAAAKVKADAEAARRKAESAGFDRAWSAAVNVGMPVAGAVLGAKLASGIESRHLATIAASNRQLTGLAKSASTVMARKQKGAALKLAGIVKSADMLKLGTRMRGPLGLGTAGVWLAEGAAARFIVAPKIESEAARELVAASGTASAFVASSLIGKRLVANATPKAMLNATALATIETARGKVTPAAAKAVQKASLATAATAGAARTVGARIALRAIPVVGWAALGYGVASNVYKSATTGGSAADIGWSAVRGAIGLDAVPAKPRGEARLTSARGTLARAAAARAAASAGSAAMKSARTVARAVRSDGMTDAHTRIVKGKVVQVKGYKTAPHARPAAVPRPR